jgi:hypothetical protein
MDDQVSGEMQNSGQQIEFEPDDFDILNMTLDLVPELRICAETVKRARRIGLRFPVRRPEALFDLLEGEVFEGESHRITKKDISRYMPPGFFPIDNENELIGRVYVALVRCNQETVVDRMVEVLGAGPVTVAPWPSNSNIIVR